MRILYDISQIFNPIGKINGIKRHIFEIVKNMINIAPENEYIFGVRPSRWKLLIKWKFIKEKDEVIEKITKINPKISKLLGFSNYMFLNQKIDIYHANNKVYRPFPMKPKIVLTLHDLIPALFPEDPEKSRKSMLSIKKSIEIADVVITVSNHVKKQICEIFNVDQNKVKVVYNGCGDKIQRKSEEEITKTLNKFQIKKPYILFVTPDKKNEKHIIDFVNKISEKIEIQIVIAGDKLDDKNKVKSVGHITDEELSALYSGALCHILPDIKEGFGLTVLEALKCGCPVITHPDSPMEEFAKDSALYARTLDETITLIKKLLENKDLRESLIKKGMKRAVEFTWERASKEVLNIYNEVLSLKN